MKKLTMPLFVPVFILALHGTSWGQIITQDRCQNAYNVSQATAQARYNWASTCRATPPVGRSGALYLSDASVTDYNNSSATLRPWLFPTYLNFITFTLWDIPATAYQSGNDCNALPDGANNVGLCVAGCFPADAHVTFGDGDVAIKQALDDGRVDLVTLAPDAALDDLDYVTNKVEAYTRDKFEAWQTIYTFSMASGGSLRVTDEHPIIVANGKMRQAKTIESGESLIQVDGSPDEVVQVDVERYFGKVYHVKPQTLDYASNIIVAQGYLNGSSRYQNEFLEMVNKVILRRALKDFPLGDGSPAR
jgi:hypothetical protein